jgi:hypothetical protein
MTMSKKEQEKRIYPFSIRLTFGERAILEQSAGHMPLGAFIRKKVLDGMTEERKRKTKRPRRPIKDDVAMAMLLAELGNAKLANNLNQLAKAANEGSLLITPDTEQAIRDAYTEILWMRRTLVVQSNFELKF